ncbi:MAG: glycerophosphodiester phosphodiesterase family protein [Candidatus Saccharimonadales bacterium]
MAGFDSPTPHLFAHRGGNAAGSNHENTLLAFQSAVELGCKFLETDVIATKDNRVITYHGSANLFMKSLFGLEIRKNVQKMNYIKVQKKIKLGEEPVPEFSEVLSKFKEQNFCIDIKTNESIKPLVEVIKRQKAEKRVIITSFSKSRSIRANRLLYGENFKTACLCVYRMKGMIISMFPAVILSRMKKQGFRYIHIPYRCVTKKLLKEAKRQDFKIYAWTVNNQSKMKELLSMGVDGIISDEVELLMKTAK